MMWLARVAAATVVRRLVLLALAALLAWAGMGKAHAQQSEYDNRCASWNSSAQCTPQQAYQMCVQNIEWYASPPNQVRDNPHCILIAGNPATTQTGGYRGVFDGGVFNEEQWNLPCPAGSTWDPDTHQCFSSQECLARNALPGYKNVGATTRSAGSQCVAGCEFKVSHGSGPTVSTSVIGQAGSLAITGIWEYTGNACAANLPDLTESDAQTKKEEECIPVGSQTMCQKANGQLCYQSSTGREICWEAGETGTKTDGPVAQDRKPGQVNPPDTKQLPNGETGTKTGDVITTVTTVTNIGGGTTTITTTTTNYNGGSGANAGDGDDGKDKGGGGKPGGDDGEKNSAAGGITCNSPPVTTGDPLLAKNVEQNWVALCRGETETKNMGDDANSLAAAADALEPQEIGIVSDEPSDGVAFDGNLLQLGSGACPPPPNVSIMGQAFQWPARFCDLVAALRLLFIAAATVMALRVVAS